MRIRRNIVLVIILSVCVCTCMYAQTDTIRYVSTSGSYNNDGLSWATPKNRLQDAINDLRDYLEVNNLSSGSVYVAAGTYVPTESTESTGGSMLNTSFKIYSGIHVYGGFNPDAPESRPGLRVMDNGKTCEQNWSDPSGIGTTSGTEIASQWNFRYKTILSGNHSLSDVTFTFDSIRGRFNTAFPASSYHVVWFATNGKIESDNEATAGHYRALTHPALVDGCVLTSGNASTRATTGHEHTAYGGGAYLVGNAELKNCIVEHCNATLRGGGVYLDGGGIVEFCYIHTCQVTGVGVVQGYGGGACIDYDGQVGHSHLTNCVARCGGGLAICHITGEYPLTGTSNYSPFSSASVINNNTASAEGGGIYLAEGGTINHATVTANECISPDVTYYGRRHGRSGGIYIRDCGMIFNSVFWGNRCETNNDIQFASVRQVTGEDYEVFVYHSAFMNHDITDWTNVRKDNVFSLEKRNMPTRGATGNFPCFFAPTVTPTNWSAHSHAEGVYGAGVFEHLAFHADSLPGPRIWHLTSYSAIDQKGVQVNDAVQDASPWLVHAHTDYGVVSNPYEPVSTLGALVRKADPLTYSLVVPQALEGRQGGTPIPTIFIDPNRKGTYDGDGNFVANETEGGSWDTPIKDIGEAIKFFHQYLVDDPGGTHHYMIPALVDGKPTGTPTRHEYVQILMKEGTVSTVGPGEYLDRNIRTASVRIESHMRLYGGYPSSLTGTNTAGRNPRDYKSVITANLTGVTGSAAYENNAAHVIIMANVEHAIVDGFTLSDANSHNVYLSMTAQAGAGVLVNNVNTAPERRIDMVGNQLRNCVINNCTSPKGAAIYVNGEYQKADGEICYAELQLVNCVIRNNKADYVTSGSSVTESHGVITANGRAYVHIEHCSIVNNVGYPFKADSKTTDTNQPIYCQHPDHNHVSHFHGYIRVDNSLIFCNGDRQLDDRGQLGSVSEVLSVNREGQDYVFGMYNMFDADLRLQRLSPDEPHGFFQSGFSVPYLDDFLPDGVESHFTDDIAGIPADSASRHNRSIFTRTSSSEPTYPMFMNPSRNVGNSPSGDKPLYGGVVSYEPLTTNPCVNAAYANGYTSTNNFDRSDVVTRDRGGAPDIGAVENEDLPAAGDVIYVTPDGAGKRDGSSWDNAIAGNTVYAISSGLMAHANAQGDKLDTLNSTTRLVNIITGEPVLTTDDRYQGGFARSWFTSSTTGRETTTTITKTWTTEVNVYDNGERAGERDTIQNKVQTQTSNVVVDVAGVADDDFEAGWGTDTRYPYGEMSGASCYQWRSVDNYCPVPENWPKNVVFSSSNTRNGVTGIGTGTRSNIIVDGGMQLRNERRENYVSGLQWAVEEASRRNHAATRLMGEAFANPVQVWVGAGKYTDYKGYVMRDSVTVLGGFPTTVYPAPGLSERQALMTATVNIPKPPQNADLNASEYETILQISETSPRSDSVTFNPSAVRFQDNDLSKSAVTNTNKHEYKNRTIVHHYKLGATTITDITSDYVYFPPFTNSSNGGATITKTYNSANDTAFVVVSDAAHPVTKDTWHLVYPNKTNLIVANMSQKASWPVYKRDGSALIENVNVPEFWIRDGSLTGLHVWNTLNNVPEGDYKLQVDMGALYNNNTSETHTGIWLSIIDASGDTCVGPIEVYHGARRQMRRFELPFSQPTNGNVILSIDVKNGKYGTGPGGADPIDIPVNGGNNRREIALANIKLYSVITSTTYEEDGDPIETITDNDEVEHEEDEVESITTYAVTKTRATLRKHVLQMPDVTQPTWSLTRLGAPETTDGNYSGDDQMELVAHTDRLNDDARAAKGTDANRRPIIDANYKRYNAVVWDGFTIRHGFIREYGMNHGGGAGVRMYEGSSLQNCIITENYDDGRRAKGAGIFCDGASSTIKNCFVLENTVQGQSGNKQVYGGGLFLYHGTCFNSLFTRNISKNYGGGTALCVGRFYNNTVVNNRIIMSDAANSGGGGIAISTVNSTPSLFVANTIVYDNLRSAISGEGTILPFINSYIQSGAALSDAITNAITTGSNNILITSAANAANNPFAKSRTDAKRDNDFALKEGSGCVNRGEEDFVSALDAILADLSSGTVKTNTKALRDSIESQNLTLPDNDVVFAKRIQDCQVDIGAYEYNAASSIRPDTTTHPGHAIYYVTFESPGGDASACTPHDGACAQKFQQIFDAAGRYKYALMTAARYSTVNPTPVAGEPDKSWIVEVRMQGDSTGSTLSAETEDHYTPVRSTKYGRVNNYIDNTLDYSLIIPHGVQVLGGYSLNFYHYEDAEGNKYDTYADGRHIVDERDPLTFRTVISGKVTSATGAEGRCYHVVTFTNDLFSVTDEKVIDEGGQLAPFDTLPDAEAHRAVLDGLFIEDGYANSPDDEDRKGAGAVVTGYAHMRNCVIRNNTADKYGGGLFLQPNALVSGCIIKQNSADIGGGIYIEAPETYNPDTLARVFSTTICDNTASSSAGGLWFDNTNARVNSTALWQNVANDNANVSGSFSRTSSDTDYPFNYCAVESRRLEGQCNIELSPSMTEGVRWDEADPFHAIQYYPVEMSSTLARAGMTYNEWRKMRRQYTTLDSMDIAGVCRIGWTGDGSPRGYAWGTDTLVTKSNDFVEIGARALNKSFKVNVDPRYVMRRLYVMHSEMLNTAAARALQNNTNTDSISEMYRQMGSCILNPLHRLGDAFDYIIAARKADPENLRNARFEVYVERGTYYPYHNAYGEQGEVRNNTFLIPEATTVIGGINSQATGHNYCQAGYIDRYTSTIVGNGNDVPVPGTAYTLDYALIDSIRLRDARHRPMRDINLNSIIESWELERQTILSGNAVSGEDFTHVYHVITIHADSAIVGPQPVKYSVENSSADWEHGERILTGPIGMSDEANFHNESERSITARSIILDGIQILGGYANHLDAKDTLEHAYQKKTYFRGGGIFVDGNWTRTFDEDDGQVPNVTQFARYNIPLVVRNCQFHDNMAANGGAVFSNGDLHVYASHFTQNYSQGPMTKLDQRFIPWSAAGCIAANAYCGIVNTLFENNEARRGLYPITLEGDENIPDADARQGFGGVISLSQTALLRAENCHFMRNKAVAYSAIYNFLANNRYTNRDSIQTAFNTIFWGNEVFEVDNIGELEHVEAPSQEAIDAFNLKYKASRAGVFHYDGSEWDKYERLFHEYDSLYHVHVLENDTFNAEVIAKLGELRAQGSKVEGLYYCSYRQSYGPTGMRSNNEGYLLTEAEAHNFTDARALRVPIKWDVASSSYVGDYTDGFTSLRGNNNVLINRVNTAADGPNFKQPSLQAGIDGYMQNADWLSTRMTVTTDQGWGHLKQTVTRDISHYITRWTGDRHFNTSAEAWAFIQDSVGASMEDVMPIHGVPVATFDDSQDFPGALYNYLAYRASMLHYDYSTPPMPCGEQVYMMHTNTDDDSPVTSMLRISKNPRMGITDAYIDIGVYEYQYIQLDLDGNEIDTVWVAPTQKEDKKHDGLSWETPTTDLQAAIDLVLSSHNNHDKYVCILGSDIGSSLFPMNVVDGRLSYTITSNSLAPLLPDSALADVDYSVKSLTFLGGYSPDVRNAERDPVAHPTVIEMQEQASRNQLNQLFVIEDMSREQVQANWQGELRSHDSQVIPVTFDGITFINTYSVKDASGDDDTEDGGVMNLKGGAAIYYRWQRQYEEADGVFTPNFNYALYPDSVLVDKHNVALPKLTLSNCIFMDNGDRTVPLAERSPAVRIDHGGGSSLIVNSLFHSNAGDPVYSRSYDVVSGANNLARVPNDVIVVNSTFALNDGHVTLASENSEMHNSIIWLDDLANDTTIQLEMYTNKWDKTAANNSRIGIDGKMTHNALWGCFRNGDAIYHNDNIVTDNNNIFQGPYFISPDISASTSGQRRQRNFQINPGVKMMNTADSAIYRSRVFYRQYPDNTLAVDNLWWLRPVGFKSADALSVTEDRDLGFVSRVTGVGMERGAYECQAAIQRVLYVRPNLAAALAGDGSSWENAFGQGQLQSAIDVASVYTYFNSDKENPDDRKAYVFVKGSNNSTERVDLIARDGVHVFGSVPGNFNDTAWLDDNRYTNQECQRYVNYVRATSPGLAAPGTAAARTRITSLKADVDDFSTGFMLDGFVISNADTVLKTAPVVLNSHTTLRNCIFTGNETDGAPLVDVQRGLVYNSLFYGNTADTLIKVGTAGLLLNNTVIAGNADELPVDSTDATHGNIINNIFHNESGGRAACFADYLTDRTPYTLPAYLTQYPELAYQLHEHSRMINAGLSANAALPTSFNQYKEDRMVNLDTDRDLLGNPRRIGGLVDMGAFETWRIEPGQVVEITAQTNKVITEAERNSAGAAMANAFNNNYGGNKYPHPGSVVYLMDSSALTMAYSLTPAVDYFSGVILRPGFMLLKPGASFYGNGNSVQMNYLAVEKRLNSQRFAMQAFPFDWYVDDVTTQSYNSATDAVSRQLSPISGRTYQYNGIARSAKDYTFRTDNSALWLPVDTAHRVATEGYLVDYRTVQDTLLRFNGFARTQGEYVYTETDDNKIVPLRQHDSHVAGTGTGLNFTRQEDMGWNMKGLPWLVSSYRTDTAVEEGNYLRQMHIPHVFYYMNGSGDYLHMTSPDRIYAARSWDPGTTLTMGDAFLTQTATMNDHEDVVFHLPYYTFNEPASRPVVRVRRRGDSDNGDSDSSSGSDSGSDSDFFTVIPDSAAGARIEYRYGRDGVKWSGTDTLTAAYIVDNARTSRVSLLGSAPLNTDIPLGINAPKADSYIFSLPEQDAFAPYNYVWLIDYDRRSYTNLKEGDYTVELPEGRHDQRFALRIGGYPIQDKDGRRQYTIFVLDGTLHIHGLLKGDHITVYSPSGQLITQAYSSGASFTTPLPVVSGYVVKVNDHTQKVLR